MVNLFEVEYGDDCYQHFRSDSLEWHKHAREAWNNQYLNFYRKLDFDFNKKFPKEFISSLWELKIANLNNQNNIKISDRRKNDVSSPDFYTQINNKNFYIECICAGKGEITTYPYMNFKPSSIVQTRDATVGYREYRERIISAFRWKAQCKYDPTRCDLTICNHSHKNGYKNVIAGTGFIIAISLAKIDLINQPMNWHVDLSCFFPCSPYKTIEFDMDKKIHNSYHLYQDSFEKGSNNNKIYTDFLQIKNFRMLVRF